MYGMNQNFSLAQQSDPSGNVPQPILPHVHLVSSFRFPAVSSLPVAQALEHLIKGPTIVKDTQPVAWTYFQTPPPDGTVLLIFQPPRMGTNFASDGLVWADPETAYPPQNIRGYNLQILHHKSGYQYPNEPVTAHARFRFRITHGPGHFDPNLWVVFWTASTPQDRIPSSQVPITRDVQAQFHMRTQIEGQGQLVRKEFMLADRPNWPKIEFAHSTNQQPPYYNPMQPGRAYNQPPPNKRPRPSLPQQRQPLQSAMAADTLDEEENSTQDMFDFITPRDISQTRYKQHQEWMEEIFSSPYAVGKILPVDLGLGLMGELAPLTAGILDTPAGEHARKDSKDKYNVKSYTKLDPEQLKKFEARVTEYTTKAEAELEKMKAAHAKKIADLKRSRTYIKAERRIRDIPAARSLDDTTDKDGADALNDIVRDLEENLGVKFDTKKDVICVDKGGFIEEQQAPTQKAQQTSNNGLTQSNAGNASNGMLETADENSAASLLDQYGSNSMANTPGTNLSFPAMSQPQSQAQSAVATPSGLGSEPKQRVDTAGQSGTEAIGGGDDLLNLDVEMSGMANPEDKAPENEWVMVDQTAEPQQSGSNVQTTAETAADNSAATGANAESTSMFDTPDFGSFDNLVDSAGDALADYTTVDDNMGLDLVDDSAFGDAFHGTELHHGETPDADNA